MGNKIEIDPVALCIDAGFQLAKNEICLAFKFAYVNDSGIVNNDVSREGLGLEQFVEELCTEVEGVLIEPRLYKNFLAVKIKEEGLSQNIFCNHAFVRTPYRQIIAKTPQAKRTARILNIFLRKSKTLLDEHPLNKRRKTPANALLLLAIRRVNFTDLKKLRSANPNVIEKS